MGKLSKPASFLAEAAGRGGIERKEREVEEFG